MYKCVQMYLKFMINLCGDLMIVGNLLSNFKHPGKLMVFAFQSAISIQYLFETDSYIQAPSAFNGSWMKLNILSEALCVLFIVSHN